MLRNIRFSSHVRWMGALTAALLITGCASLFQPTSIKHSNWQLTRFMLAPAGESWSPSPARFTLEIGENHASGQIACNRWNGNYRLVDSYIEFGTLASTKVRCHPQNDQVARLQAIYLDRLMQGARIATPRSDLLVLTFSDGLQWQFARVPE